MNPCEPARYTAYRATGPITIDGKLDEPSWLGRAPGARHLSTSSRASRHGSNTRVAILWDDDNLYFGFQAEETDVWGELTERDSKIWLDNDLEVFIDGGRDVYYEFEVNALNTVYEVFWIWKDIFTGSKWEGRPEFNPATQRTLVLDGVGGHVHERGERWGFLDWDFPGLRTAIHVDGVLNSRTKTDRGWSAEIAFPWKGMELLRDGRALPPKDGDVWRIDCSRFEKVGRNGEALDPSAGWTWNLHGHYDSHIPEVFPYRNVLDAAGGRAALTAEGAIEVGPKVGGGFDADAQAQQRRRQVLLAGDDRPAFDGGLHRAQTGGVADEAHTGSRPHRPLPRPRERRTR